MDSPRKTRKEALIEIFGHTRKVERLIPRNFRVFRGPSFTLLGLRSNPLLHWAREHGHVVLTQDLDFSRLLFTSRAHLPSVVILQVRDESDEEIRTRFCGTLRQLESQRAAGAIIIWTPERARVRLLPIDPD